MRKVVKIITNKEGIVRNEMKKRGFTLIELLVVIAIIAILATVVIINVSGARKKATDAKIKSDMNAVENAFGVYAASGKLFSALTDIKIPLESFISFSQGDADQIIDEFNNHLIPHVPTNPTLTAPNNYYNYYISNNRGYSSYGENVVIFTKLTGVTTGQGMFGCQYGDKKKLTAIPALPLNSCGPIMNAM